MIDCLESGQQAQSESLKAESLRLEDGAKYKPFSREFLMYCKKCMDVAWCASIEAETNWLSMFNAKLNLIECYESSICSSDKIKDCCQ